MIQNCLVEFYFTGIVQPHKKYGLLVKIFVIHENCTLNSREKIHSKCLYIKKIMVYIQIQLHKMIDVRARILL